MSNMIKRAFVKVEEAGKLIDSNRLISDKMEKIAEEAFAPLTGENAGGEGSDEFTEGLVADKVEMLLGDQDAEGADAEGLAPSNVIRNSEADEAAAQAAAEAVAKAQADAESLMAEANEQAQAIIAEAKTQAGSIREEARNEGFTAGHDEGYQAGLQEAEALKDEYQGMITALEEEYQKKMEELEPMFVDTLTDIYEHIFRVNFSDSKEVIFHLIQNAVRKVEGGDTLLIHVSKDDYGYVSMQRKELLAGITGAEEAEIVEDMTLKSNECFIETGGGIFDCSLETQLTGLKRELMLLSYEKTVPQGEEDG